MPLRHFCNWFWPVPCTVATRLSKRFLGYKKLRLSCLILSTFRFTKSRPDFRLIEILQLELDAFIGLEVPYIIGQISRSL